ncbi:hypothetical protein B484DRAFT_454802 [Ochromonadaceae sp. CCMP2298]|nr:hypothetical protein B484DRAFT_454802 [Ochromonadaceae sp. CCMP2298]
MPPKKQKTKVIKDGAYTIVVDDTSSNIAKPTKRENPDNYDDDDDDDDNDDEDNFEEEEDENMWELGSEESEEDIDFADPAFILNNLKLAVPDYKADTTGLLLGRQDLAAIVCSQVRFYCYCAFSTFLKYPKPVTILVIGEGFIGARIVKDLLANGCRDMLRICTRGDLTAAEWRKKGLNADNSLPNLLNGVQPDILILSVENANFPSICHQLVSNYLVSESTLVISCSFGFQRRKLFTQLNSPTILRIYVEPHEIMAERKQKAEASLRAAEDEEGVEGKDDDVTVAESMTAEMLTSPMSTSVHSTTHSAAHSHTAELLYQEDGFFPGAVEGQDSPEPEPVPLPRDPVDIKAAATMASRIIDSRNMIHELENYYSLQHYGYSEARGKALSNVLGLTLPGHVFSQEVPGPSTRLQAQMDRPSAKVQSFDDSYELMSLRKYLKTQAKCKSKVEVAMKKILDTGSVAVFQEAFRARLAEADLEQLLQTRFTDAQNVSKTGPNAHLRPHLDNKPGQVRKDTAGVAMYSSDFILDIFRSDENISSCEGAGFDLMRQWEGENLPLNKNASLDFINTALNADVDADVADLGRRMTAYDNVASNIKSGYVQSLMTHK